MMSRKSRRTLRYDRPKRSGIFISAQDTGTQELVWLLKRRCESLRTVCASLKLHFLLRSALRTVIEHFAFTVVELKIANVALFMQKSARKSSPMPGAPSPWLSAF